MPNHVTSVITLYGDESRIKTMLEEIKNDEIGLGSVDFNKILPMPDNIYRGNLGTQELTKYGDNNWYDWSNANWGTKWNACDTYYDSDTGTCVEFETAWCPPMPVIEKIFKDNPGCEIKFTSYDEDYTGHYELFHDKNNEIYESTYWVDECANDYEGVF